VKRCPRQKCRVSIFFAFSSASGIDAPAIANDKHNRTCHTSRTLPTIANIDKRFPAAAGLTRRITRIYIALVKWRNQLLALFCLLAFAGLGVLYFKHWVVQKPFGILLFIAEGLAPDRLAATRLYLGGADARLALDSMNHSALLINYSKDFAVPDQAAAATALATGVRVNNRAISINGSGKPLTSIIELAREHGRATGLVTNGKLTDATSAAFYAHPADTDDVGSIAREFVEGGEIDIAMGGGAAQFLPETKGGERQDNRDLLLELRRNGFDIVRTRAELEEVPAWRRPKLFGVFGRAELAFVNQTEERNEQPNLADMVRRAIELLQYNAGGYLLVVDAGLMRKAAQENNGERTLGETVELDRAVATARRYAGQKSTIIVCGDVAIGGMHMNGFPFRKDSGIALLGLNSAGEPWITWATGPNGLKFYGAAKVPGNPNVEIKAEPLEPAAFYAKSALNTVDDVVAFGSGPGTSALAGSVENTTIFKIVRDEL
jgi:alkaline phosphatase